MCWFRIATICASLVFVSLAQELIVTGPYSFRSNQNYSFTIFNMKDITVNLEATMIGFGDNGIVLFNQTKPVKVEPKVFEELKFEIPEIRSRGKISGRLIIYGKRRFFYNEEVELDYIPKSISGLIQLSKPVYKPGDSVQFRVIVLDLDLKPPSRLKIVTVTVKDSNGNNIRKWYDAPLYNGVFEGHLDIAPSPLLGTYNIIVEENNEKLVSKSFKVKEYVLSTFKVHVYPTVIPLEEHQALDLMINATYFFGKPVVGTVKIQLNDEDNNLHFSKVYEINGTRQVHIPFSNGFIVFEDKLDVAMDVTFTEGFTNRTVFTQPPVTVYKNKYQVRFTGEPEFKAESSNHFKLAVANQDGSPAKGVSLTVKIDLDDEEKEVERIYKSDDNGVITLDAVNSTPRTNTITIAVSIDDTDLLSTTLKKASPYYLNIKKKSNIHLRKSLTLDIRCSHKMTMVLYYIISKGNLVDFAWKRVNGKSSQIEISKTVTINMVPRSHVLVATVINNTFLYSIVTIDSDQMANNIQLIPKEHRYDLLPDNTIELLIRGRPNAYVALASYDRTLLQHGQDHDISWEDVLKPFNEHHTAASKSLSDSIGLFVRANGLEINTVEDKSSRADISSTHGQSKRLDPFRSDFLESWLWKNYTLPEDGSYRLMHPTPDTTTFWNLNGFSIDSVYGFGIIKQPLQLTTSLPFYIVDNLPYSIRRSEAVALQFTLFNTFGVECESTVTMYNPRGQFEFVNQSGAKNQTKSVTVSPTDGTPVTFLVEAKTLGEMTVLVKALAVQEQKVDAIERHVRVLPENMMRNGTVSRFFWHGSHKSSSHDFVLDIDRNAVPESIKIYFSVSPNLVMKVGQNLENLLEIPTNTGDQSLIHFAPSLVILQYEEAMRSEESDIYKKAKKQLLLGYQEILKYEKTDGSFGVWWNIGDKGVDEKSVFVTAFVTQCMIMAEKYLSVEQAKVAKALEWLASKQQDNGSFIETGSIVYNDLQSNERNGIALTSFVMIAFLKMRKVENQHQAIIEKGMAYIANHVDTIVNNFDLSIATYALHLNGHQKRELALTKLRESSVSKDEEVQRFWDTSTSKIETAAFALLSLGKANIISHGVEVMRWLVNQTYETGSFHHSFDTTFGLMAIAEFTQKITTHQNDYQIRFSDSNFLTGKEFRIFSGQESILPTLIQTVQRKKFTASVSGIGTGILRVTYEYLINSVNITNQFELTLTKLNSTSSTVLKLRVCSRFKHDLARKTSDLTRVEVNLPSGYVVRNNPISNPTTANPIRETKILYGSTTAVLYYEKSDNTNNCFTITAYRVFNVVYRRPAYVKVQDVYNPERTATRLYEVEKQHVCTICSKADCPDSCKQYVK